MIIMKQSYKLKFIDSFRFMSASLPSLVDNLSEINKKNVKKRNNIKSEHKFIKFKNNRLNYKFKECNDKSYKPINGLIKKFPNINFVTKILIHLFCS